MNSELYMRERFGVSRIIDESFNDLKPNIEVVKNVRELLIKRLNDCKDINELIIIILAFYSYTKKYKVFNFLNDFYKKSFNSYANRVSDYSFLIDIFNSDYSVLDNMLDLMELNLNLKVYDYIKENPKYLDSIFEKMYKNKSIERGIIHRDYLIKEDNKPLSIKVTREKYSKIKEKIKAILALDKVSPEEKIEYYGDYFDKIAMASVKKVQDLKDSYEEQLELKEMIMLIDDAFFKYLSESTIVIDTQSINGNYEPKVKVNEEDYNPKPFLDELHDIKKSL